MATSIEKALAAPTANIGITRWTIAAALLLVAAGRFTEVGAFRREIARAASGTRQWKGSRVFDVYRNVRALLESFDGNKEAGRSFRADL